MKLPLQVTFKNLEHSDFIENAVREKASKLDQYFSDIMSCRVVIESVHKNHNKGNTYDVLIDITVPGKEIVVSRDPGLNHAHEDVYVAIRDAFNAAKRQLQNYNAQLKRHVKTHEVPPHGTVMSVNEGEGYGFIRTPDNREVYFHENSLLNVQLKDLEVGVAVRYHEETGEEGPQASSVTVEGKHHIVG